MGTNGTIAVLQRDFRGKSRLSVYLFQHSDGGALPVILAHALHRSRDRWEQEPYLARVIFSQMLMEHMRAGRPSPKEALETLESELGFGISTYFSGSSVDMLVVDPVRRRVGIAPIVGGLPSTPHSWRSFDEWIEKHGGPAATRTNRRGARARALSRTERAPKRKVRKR